MKKYCFDRFSPESIRLINQAGVRAKMIPKEGCEKYNAAWDGMVTPDGVFYYPLSSEIGMCGNTSLARYDFDANEVHVVLNTNKLLLPVERQFPHSKFHTSLNTMPRSAFFPEMAYDSLDYLVIGTTHSTDRAVQHEEWMPFGHHNHTWEGFPGSQIIVYDPKNGHSWTLGVPVPRESIYGAKYEPKHNRLYMIGFMRGHVYCFDFNERRVIKDLGKAAEVFTYRLSLGSDGHIYGCSKSGQMFRINTDTVELENMAFHVPDLENNFVSATWYRYLVAGRNHPSGKSMYLAFVSMDTMYKLDFDSGAVTPIGSCIPNDGLYELPARDASWTIRGFDVDKEGVLWIIVSHWSIHNDTEYFIPRAMYLIRWDVENGEEPFCCGLVGTPEYYQDCVSEVEYDPVKDILYFVNTATERPFGQHRPMAGGIDLKVFREHYHEKGPVCEDTILNIRKMTPEEVAEHNRIIDCHGGEENAVHNPFAAFDPLKLTPVRVWRSFPRQQVDMSKVIGMAFQPDRTDENYLLHVVCGDTGRFDSAYGVLEIAHGKVQKVTLMEDVSEKHRQWLRANILPQEPQFDEAIKLPEAAGRRYRAKASCVVDWKNGGQFVGTMDALAAIVSKDGNVYCLGNAAAYGPIRSMVANKAKDKLWGVAGDDEDMGYIFTYDDRSGLRQLGIINYNTYGYFDGPVAANLLSSIALSPDEKYLAVGSADRIAMVCIVKL